MTTQEKPRNRFLAAWHVLMGRRTTPMQIEAEWLEYRLMIEDLLRRFGAQLARSAKAEKDRLKRELAEQPAQIEPPMMMGKAAVRARVASMRGVGVPSSRITNGITTAEDEAP